jgi:hypothetical protein
MFAVWLGYIARLCFKKTRKVSRRLFNQYTESFLSCFYYCILLGKELLTKKTHEKSLTSKSKV